MRLLALSLVAVCFGACTQRPISKNDVYTLYGDRHTISDADRELALNAVRGDMIKRYGAQGSISRVYVIDRNHITVRCWPKDIEIWAKIERIHGRWVVAKWSNHSLQPTAGRSDN